MTADRSTDTSPRSFRWRSLIDERHAVLNQDLPDVVFSGVERVLHARQERLVARPDSHRDWEHERQVALAGGNRGHLHRHLLMRDEVTDGRAPGDRDIDLAAGDGVDDRAG